MSTTSLPRQHASLFCGYATVCAMPVNGDRTERYVLPGGEIITCRDQARAAAVQLDAAIRRNGGTQSLRKVFAA